MAFHNISPAREQVRAEMMAALAGGVHLTTNDLYTACPSAVDVRDVSRLCYEMRKKGAITTGETTINAIGLRVNTFCLADPTDPRLAAAKPIVVERKIPRTVKAKKPAASNPYAQFTVSKPQEAAPRVTRDLPQHLQSPAPQLAAEGIHHHILEEAMSEDPLTYIPDPDSFTLEPKEPEAEEDIDSELIDALQGLAEFVPLPMAADDVSDEPMPMISDHTLAIVHAMAEGEDDDVGEIAQALKEKQTPEPLLSHHANKSCQCLRINNLPPLPDGYVYGGIKVWIEAKHDVGHISISTHDEGGGPFCSLKASGHLSFDSGDLVAIGRVADALIKLHASMDVTGA